MFNCDLIFSDARAAKVSIRLSEKHFRNKAYYYLHCSKNILQDSDSGNTKRTGSLKVEEQIYLIRSMILAEYIDQCNLPMKISSQSFSNN
jgi:hypothetical protein